jgi:hypothetical protein
MFSGILTCSTTFDQPAWEHLEFIARAAELFKAEISDIDPDIAVKTFVSQSVQNMLSKLYEKISSILDVINEKQTESTNAADFVKIQSHRHFAALKTWVKDLYSDNDSKDPIYIVGPVGERPIHSCAFAVAKHRSMKEDFIADGILDGMQQYVKEMHRSKFYEEYGKDYCAAVGCFLWKKFGKVQEFPGLHPSSYLNTSELDMCNDDRNKLVLKAIQGPRTPPIKGEDLWQFLPYIRQVIMWLRKNGDSYITRLGIYEGETPHFALIACCDKAAVEWFIKEEIFWINKSHDKTEANGKMPKQRFAMQLCIYIGIRTENIHC